MKKEKERVNARMNVEMEDDILLVHELVKKYDTKDPDAQTEDLNSSIRSDRPLD